MGASDGPCTNVTDSDSCDGASDQIGSGVRGLQGGFLRVLCCGCHLSCLFACQGSYSVGRTKVFANRRAGGASRCVDQTEAYPAGWVQSGLGIEKNALVAQCGPNNRRLPGAHAILCVLLAMDLFSRFSLKDCRIEPSSSPCVQG